ncbi:MAG: hypothetical protein K5866_08530 [Treponema sp.]|nr:hypothetical protein [Treponema sp.]
MILFSAATSLFAVDEYVSNIYKEIDQSFSEKSEEVLNEILQKYQNDKNYYLIENYAQKKVRRLVLSDEYTFAMDAIVIIIENNLDNESALELYSMISDAYDEQKHQEELALQAEEAKAQRIEVAKERQRGSVDKEYISTATTSGGQVYISGADTKLSHSSWLIDFGLMNFANLMDTSYDPAYNGFNYGISLDYSYAYSSNEKTFGIDTEFSGKFLSVGDGSSDTPIFAEIEVMPKMAWTNFSKKFFLRFGMVGLVTGKSAEAETSRSLTIDNFYSPALGMSLERLNIGSSYLTFNMDYLPGHLFYENIKAAASAKAMVTIPFGETEKFNMILKMGIKDYLFVKSEGIENRASVVLAIGAENGSK